MTAAELRGLRVRPLLATLALAPVWALIVVFGVLGAASLFAAYSLSDLEGWLYQVRTGEARRTPLF